jgi:transposase
VIANLAIKATPDPWLQRLCARRNANIAAVGLANKNARIVWALLARGDTYQPGYRSPSPLAA